MNLWDYLPGLTKTESESPKSKPRILIGIAGFNGVLPEAQESIFALAYYCGKFMPEYDFFLRVIPKREQFRARNHLVEMAQINRCDYLLMIDDDMIVPQNLLKKLMAHNKDVTGALYFQRGGAYHPVLMHRVSSKDGLEGIDFVHHFDERLVNPGLHEFDIIGGGCMLFKTSIFEKLQKPYFWIDGIVGTDVHICLQLRDAGVKIYADTSIELGHLGPPLTITSRTVPRYSRVIGEVNQELWEDLKAYLHVTDDELQSEMIFAAGGDARAEEWNKEDRSTWEGVKRYYQNTGRTGLLNLAVYNLRYDQGRDWAINESGKILKAGSRVVDYGCGLGYLSHALAQRNGYQVYALDVDGTPTMEFLKWRQDKHNVNGAIVPWEFEAPVPHSDLETPVDGVFMISVLEHLWDPYGALEWATRNVKPGGFLYCDGWHQLQKPGEPQHIVNYDCHKITKDFEKMGWEESPENPFLYFKSR